MMMQPFGLGFSLLLGLCSVTYADGTIKGVSTDALDQHVVQLAHIELRNPQQQIITSTLSNMSGQYQLQAPAGQYQLHVSHPDYREFAREIMLKDDKVLRVNLELLARVLPPLSPTAEHSVYEQLQLQPASP
jgi:hypothetical protein